GDTKTLDTNGPSGHPTHQHFGGWSLDGNTPSISSVTFDSSDITVKAIWLDDTTYKLSYDANGGSGTPSDVTGNYSGDTVTLDTNGPWTAPLHKHFGGWSLTVGGSAVTSVTFDGADITVYAIWVDDTTYKLSYDANGGSGAPSDVTGNYSGDTVTLDTNGPSTAPLHKHFGGWSLTSGGSAVTSVTFDGADITVYAIWVDDSTYSLSYDANGGSGAPSGSSGYYSGDNPTLDTNGPSTAPLHKHFGGWSLTAGGSAVTSVTFDGADITVYAIWLDDAGYNLTYDANGGSGAPVDSTTYYSGDTKTLSTSAPSTAPLHKHFGGWSLTVGGSAVTSVTFSNSNITVYAIWLNDTSYTLTYNANGGSGAPVDSNRYYSGDTKTLAGGPTTAPTGYKFNCWSLTTNGACVSSVTFSNSNITVYAIWISTGSKANNGFGNGTQPAPGNSCGNNGAYNKGCVPAAVTNSGSGTQTKAKSNLNPVSKPIVSITSKGAKSSKSAASKARVQSLAGKKLGKLGQTLALAKVRIVLA
ncbi:MAG: InlB B-repeat-containing protein, partial [Micrococcales bacterium]